MKGKVIDNKYGLQIVVDDNTYYRVGKDSAERFKPFVGQEVEFEESTSEYQGKTYKWANVPKKQSQDGEKAKTADDKDNTSQAKGLTMLYALYLELEKIFKEK